METCACIYDLDSSKIVLYYVAKEITELEALEKAKQKLPMYMWPNEIIKIQRMPYNSNGKIDRKK